MGAKDKRDQERIEAIDRRKRDVISAAKIVFAAKSIEKATILDIATQAEVGVASVYRYYTNKTELVLGVALNYIENELAIEEVVQGSGIEQTLMIMNGFLKKINENPQMLLFIQQLDAYVLHIEDDDHQLKVYEKIKTHHAPQLINAIEKGKQDGSIRKDINSNEVGNTCLEVFIALVQKNLLREQLRNKPCDSQGIAEIYKEMILNYLKVA